MSEPVSPADTIRRDATHLLRSVVSWGGVKELIGADLYDRSMIALRALDDERAALLAVGERDKAEEERQKKRAERAEQVLREQVAANRTLVVAGERDRQQIAQLTEVKQAAQEFVDAENQDTAALARLIGEPDPDGTLFKVQALTRANADAAFHALAAVLAGEEDAGHE